MEIRGLTTGNCTQLSKNTIYKLMWPCLGQDAKHAKVNMHLQRKYATSPDTHMFWCRYTQKQVWKCTGTQSSVNYTDMPTDP